MNEMNSLEAQLKSWRPRRPSARLEQNLFGASTPGSSLTQSFGWLTPAVACVLFTFLFFNQQGQTPYLLTSTHEEIVAMSLSNQGYAAYLPGSFKQEQNRWDTFEWTNGGNYTSSMHPFPQGKTDGPEQR